MIRVQSSKNFTRFILGLFLVVAAYFAYTMFTQQQLIDQQNTQKAQLETQLAHLQGSNESLQRQIESTTTDAYIEDVAREKLGWVKPGEILFVEEKP